ncbi:MAG: DUF1573 domain-containing protein [Gemmataceae bacterium]
MAGLSCDREIKKSEEHSEVTPAGAIHVTREIPPVFGDLIESLTCDFTVRNETNSTINFREVQSSCGCTKAQLEMKSLEPGQETVLHLNINVRGRYGKQLFSCT